MATVGQQRLIGKLPITVIVPVLNEERNLPACLRSVAGFDEVVVVDSGSVDRTASIAGAMNARVETFRHRSGGPRKKNWALASLDLRNDWVLLLDADERVTADLEAELRALFARGPEAVGYYVDRRFFFLGRWLRHGGMAPSWNLRLLLRDAGRFERSGTEALESAGDVEVHEHIRLDGPAEYLKAPLDHIDRKDLHHFIERHNRYSTWDAQMRRSLAAGKLSNEAIAPRLFGAPVERKRFLKRFWERVPCRPLARFVYIYLIRLGFLDGKAGFLHACFKAIQEFHIDCKRYEAELAVRTSDSAPIEVPIEDAEGTENSGIKANGGAGPTLLAR